MNQIADASEHLSQVEEELELDLGKYSALLLAMRCELQHCLLAAGLKEESEENTVNIAGLLVRTPCYLVMDTHLYKWPV